MISFRIHQDVPTFLSFLSFVTLVVPPAFFGGRVF
jgi:hypothetical protein